MRIRYDSLTEAMEAAGKAGLAGRVTRMQFPQAGQRVCEELLRLRAVLMGRA